MSKRIELFRKAGLNVITDITQMEQCEKEKKELIEEFLKRLDWILEHIEFHTENPDSELIDEVSEEYKKWERRKE